jgi:hypothetical protein
MNSRTLPTTLPARVYLLACDVDRQRLRGQDVGVVVRGALFADLSLRGCLVEENDVVRPASSRRTGDAVLDDELRIMAESEPRSWRALLRRGGKTTLAAVQDQLASAGQIKVEHTRRLGIFPATRVTLTNPAQVATLRESVREAVRGTGPVSAVSTEDAAQGTHRGIRRARRQRGAGAAAGAAPDQGSARERLRERRVTTKLGVWPEVTRE